MWGCQRSIHHTIIWCMPEKINIDFGGKLKEIRQQQNMTQEKLAELTRTSYKYIQRIEGKNPPDIRLSTIERIAKALKIRVSQFFKL